MVLLRTQISSVRSQHLLLRRLYPCSTVSQTGVKSAHVSVGRDGTLIVGLYRSPLRHGFCYLRNLSPQYQRFSLQRRRLPGVVCLPTWATPILLQVALGAPSRDSIRGLGGDDSGSYRRAANRLGHGAKRYPCTRAHVRKDRLPQLVSVGVNSGIYRANHILDLALGMLLC
jgi:hypothetical protein